MQKISNTSLSTASEMGKKNYKTAANNNGNKRENNVIALGCRRQSFGKFGGRYSRLMACGASASPFTLSLSAVLRKAGNWS